MCEHSVLLQALSEMIAADNDTKPLDLCTLMSLIDQNSSDKPIEVGDEDKSGVKDDKTIKNEGYKPGDVIQTFSAPFVRVLSKHAKDKRCDFCFILPVSPTQKLYACKSCKLLNYCDKPCQLKDWKNGHKFECTSAFFRRAEKPEVWLLKRKAVRLYALLTRKKSNLRSKQFEMHDKSTRSLNDVISSHNPTQYKKLVTFAQSMSEALVNEAIPPSECSSEFILKLIGLWLGYAVPLRNDDDTETIGYGLFMEPFAFGHSCKPNAFINLNGATVELRAIGDVPLGVKPTYCHLRGTMDYRSRCLTLRNRFGWSCSCETCKEEVTGCLINYKEAKQLDKVMEETDDPEEYYEMHEKLVGMLRKVYHEFDPRISYRYLLDYRTLALSREGATKAVLEKMEKVADKQMLVTFGGTHTHYILIKRIMTRVNNLGN